MEKTWTMEINALNESSAQFCMICLDMHSKLYPSNQHNLDMKYQSLTGILLADVFFFTPMFCSECAQRLNNCCKFRDKTLRAYQLLSELFQTNAVLSQQTLSSVDRARCQLTSNLVKKTFEPNHCDLYVTKDTWSYDKVNVKNEEIDLHEKLHIKCETEFDLDLESGDVCDDAAEFTVEFTNNEDIDIDFDINEDIQQAANDVTRRGGDMKIIPTLTHANINNNKDVFSAISNIDATKIDVRNEINNVRVVSENDELSVGYKEIDVIFLNNDISDNIYDGNQTMVNKNEYDNYVRFVKENISNPDKVDGGKTVAYTAKNNDVNTTVSLSNLILVRETDKRSVSKGTNANETHVLVNNTKNNDVNNIVSQNNVILVRGTDKQSVSNETRARNHVLVQTDCDLELESGDICDDGAEITADDVDSDVEITNDDANNGVDVVYIDDSSNDDIHNHGMNMQSEQNNTNVKSHEILPDILNHNITNADLKWLNDLDDDIDIDFDINEDIQQTVNDVTRCVVNVEIIPTHGKINSNKYVFSDISNVHAAKIDVRDETNNVRVIDENEELSVDNIVSQNNVTDKKSVSNGPHATTNVLVKKRAAKRKQPPSDERKLPRKRNRKKIIRPEKIEEPKYKMIKSFKRIERSPEEQVADWAKRQESEKYKEALYKCTDCYKYFNVENTYNLHMEKHTDKYGVIECHICRVRVRSRRVLMQHLRKTHKFLLRCTECAFVTTCVETATHHSQWHDGKTYECPHCGKVCTKPSSYYTHVRLAHPSDAVCALCGYSFIGKRGLWMHQNKAHRDDKQELSGPQCSQCNVRFASEAAYETHLQVSPKHGAPRYNRKRQSRKVTWDKARILRETERRKRLRDRAAPFKRKFICEQCGKLCNSKFLLSEHVLRHGSPTQQCDACDKKYYSPTALKLHVERMHSTEQRRDTYACAHCAYQTKERGNFTRHMQVHMDSNVRKWFHCSVCGKKTTTKIALQDHMRHVHEKVPWPARVRASRARAAAPRTRDTDSSES